MKFLLGRKIGTTQLFRDREVVPVTLVQAGPCVVTRLRTAERDGYTAVQVGLQQKRRMSKPVKGQLKGLPAETGSFAVLREFRIPQESDLTVGTALGADVFSPGDRVRVSGISKGKGFQGGIKRHGFTQQPVTHGQKNRQRHPGSIGPTVPQRVFKGTRMAGRMGTEVITVRNLEVIEVDPGHHLIAVRGAVPGIKGTLLELRVEGLMRHGQFKKAKVKK